MTYVRIYMWNWFYILRIYQMDFEVGLYERDTITFSKRMALRLQYTHSMLYISVETSFVLSLFPVDILPSYTKLLVENPSLSNSLMEETFCFPFYDPILFIEIAREVRNNTLCEISDA